MCPQDFPAIETIHPCVHTLTTQGLRILVNLDHEYDLHCMEENAHLQFN